MFAVAWLVACLLVAADSPSPPVRVAGDFSLLAVGDYAFPAGKYDATLDRRGPAFLDAVRPLIDAADVRFLNLETPVTERPFALVKEYLYRMPAHRLGWVIDAGFNLLSLANNHMGDAGEVGVQDTEAALREAAAGRRVAWAGAGDHLGGDDLQGPWGSIRFFAVSCTKYGQVAKPGDWLTRAIRAARAEGRTVVVSAHCGVEYVHQPPAFVVRLYRSLVDAGADVVIGHHPHVVQGVETRGPGVILYSLGNFALSSLTRRHLQTGARMYGLMARIEFEGGRPARVVLIPTWASNSAALVVGDERLEPTPFRPLPAHGMFARRITEEIQTFSAAVEGNRTRIEFRDDTGVVRLGEGR